MADAVARPERYVIKPQREGGGNNIYGPAVAAALGPAGLSPRDRAAHTLMERVFPRAADSVFVALGRATAVRAISELGIYSVFLSDGCVASSLSLCVGGSHPVRSCVGAGARPRSSTLRQGTYSEPRWRASPRGASQRALQCWTARSWSDDECLTSAVQCLCMLQWFTRLEDINRH